MIVWGEGNQAKGGTNILEWPTSGEKDSKSQWAEERKKKSLEESKFLPEPPPPSMIINGPSLRSD